MSLGTAKQNPDALCYTAITLKSTVVRSPGNGRHTVVATRSGNGTVQGVTATDRIANISTA